MPRERAISVRDRMSRRVTTVRPDSPLGAAARLMRDRAIRHLPVVDGSGQLVGIVTARDLRQALFAPAVQAEGADLRALLDGLTVADVMTRGVVSVRAVASIRDAARLMYERRLGALPVVERGRLVGILTESDVLRAFQELLGDAGPAVISV
ncbi:MAG TPA: CBS domain-containing protein [Candidatus Binatia bacterium]|nr:CBS domain-containing protein [Candidatus Binatia bacterium]